MNSWKNLLENMEKWLSLVWKREKILAKERQVLKELRKTGSSKPKTSTEK